MSDQPSRDLVLRKLRDCFPESCAAADALAILDLYGSQSWHSEPQRVQLAMLMQSRGDLKRLWQLAELADKDYRDVLVGAEYPEEFAAPFDTDPQALDAMRKRDREQYERWLQSGRS